MDKSFNTSTNSSDLIDTSTLVASEAPNINTIIKNKNLILIGVWTATLLLGNSGSVSAQSPYDLSTSLKKIPYIAKSASTETQNPILADSTLLIAQPVKEPLDSNTIINLPPKKAYETELIITSLKKGSPITEPQDENS